MDQVSISFKAMEHIWWNSLPDSSWWLCSDQQEIEGQAEDCIVMNIEFVAASSYGDFFFEMLMGRLWIFVFVNVVFSCVINVQFGVFSFQAYLFVFSCFLVVSTTMTKLIVSPEITFTSTTSSVIISINYRTTQTKMTKSFWTSPTHLSTMLY